MAASSQHTWTWTKDRPTRANVGQWFFVRYNDPTNPDSEAVYFKEVTELDGQLRLASECDAGMQQKAIGHPLDFYSPVFFEFCGPVAVPPELEAMRRRAYPDKPVVDSVSDSSENPA